MIDDEREGFGGDLGAWSTWLPAWMMERIKYIRMQKVHDIPSWLRTPKRISRYARYSRYATYASAMHDRQIDRQNVRETDVGHYQDPEVFCNKTWECETLEKN